MKKIFCLLYIFILILLCGCATTDRNKTRKDVIAVSIVPQATFVKKVCGDKFDVITMIPPGASAETYEPTMKQMAEFEDSRIYFTIGVPSEENSILPSVKSNTKTVSLHTEAEKLYPEISINNERDPHIWLSPKRVIVMIDTIAEELAALSPENRDFFFKNAKDYKNELSGLEKEINDTLKDVKNRKFIAYHPAFGYFAEDFSLTMYALEEHGKEADAKRLSEISDLARKEKITTVFYQAEASGRQAEAFAEEIGGKAVCLDPLSADYTENLKKMAFAIKEAMN